MHLQSHLLPAILSIRWSKARRALLTAISLICLCAGLLFSLQHGLTAFAQSQPTQAQLIEVDRLIDECNQLSNQKNYQQAVETCQKAVAAAKAVNDSSRQTNAHAGLGDAYAGGASGAWGRECERHGEGETR